MLKPISRAFFAAGLLCSGLLLTGCHGVIIGPVCGPHIFIPRVRVHVVHECRDEPRIVECRGRKYEFRENEDGEIRVRIFHRDGRITHREFDDLEEMEEDAPELYDIYRD